jgi:hypothetical protein
LRNDGFLRRPASAAELPVEQPTTFDEIATVRAATRKIEAGEAVDRLCGHPHGLAHFFTHHGPIVVHPEEEVKDARPRAGVNLIALESRARP